MKINNIIFSLFLFHILFIQIFSNYIILPFNTKKINSSSFISKTNHFTLLSIGQPKKTIEMYLMLRQYNFYLGKGLCQSNSFSDYIPYESETFKNNSDYEYQIPYIKNVSNVTDEIFLYANDLDLKKNITIKDMDFYYGVNNLEPEIVNKEKVCGVIGFNANYIPSKSKIENYFINTLKKKNITSSYAISFIFLNKYTKNIFFSESNKYNNLLIVGMSETEISKSFNSNDLRTIEIINYPDYDWRISFDEIFLIVDNSTLNTTNKQLISTDTDINFNNEFDFIIVQEDNFNFISDYFFKEYIENNICILNRAEEDSSYYYYISCDINFKKEINKFPNIYFMIRDINYTFVLTYEDLFIEFNQKIYFMLVRELNQINSWTFGNIFLKKYPLIFDYDKKTITYISINEPLNNEENFKFRLDYLLFFIGGICIIIGICLGIIISRNIYNKNKKKNANELIDDYDDYENNIKEANNEKKLCETNNIIIN